MAIHDSGTCGSLPHDRAHAPPRIAYVITDLDVGGVPLHLRRLAIEMRSRGFEITVVSLATPGPVGNLLRDEGLDVRSCEARNRWDVRVLPRLAAVLRDINPDVVHSFLFHANVATRWAAARIGYPSNRVLCEIQTVEIERPWHLWVDRCTHEACRYTIGNSPSVIEHLHQRAAIPRERLRLIRGGIDTEPLNRAQPVDRSTLGLTSYDKMILWVGRLDPVKGLTYLLDAFAQLDQRPRAHLCLAGDGPLRERLERHANHLALHDRIHWLGPRHDVPGLLKTCDVFAFPSRTEGLPNALLEAMAAACPIVTTDVPGCRDLIRHKDTGLLVPYGDTHALATAIRLLCVDRSREKQWGQRTAHSAAKEWRIDAMFNAYQLTYREIIGSTPFDHGSRSGPSSPTP